VRCSSSPLLAHGFTSRYRKLRKEFSLDSLLIFIASPSDNPGQLIKNPLEFQQTAARRMQSASFKAIISQTFITVILGILVAYSVPLPSTLFGHNRDDSMMVITCVSTMAVHLLNTALDGCSHELNPNRYRLSQQWTRNQFAVRIKSFFQSLITSTIFVLLSGLASFRTTTAATWTFLGFCVVVSSLITLYLHLYDETLRTLLCSPPTNMKRVVESCADDDRQETYLDVAMYSILHSDDALVKKMSLPSPPGYRNLEREEGIRNQEAIKTMAKTLLRPSPGDRWAAHLEDDIFRLAILSSLGGTSFSNGASGGIEKAEPYHVDNIVQWLLPDDKMKMEGLRHEPLIVPLVRALCALTGGLGEAMATCSSDSLLASSWQLPPGAISCAEYSVRASARCIVLNFTYPARPVADWRSTHLSSMVPVFLYSVYLLEAGMLRFANSKSIGAPAPHLGKVELFKTESPEFLPLYFACMDSVMMVLSKLKTLEGFRRLDFDLDRDCQVWMEALLGQMNIGSL